MTTEIMRYRIRLHEDESGEERAFHFPTREEAVAFREGVEYVNDSTITILPTDGQLVEKVHEPPATAHCDTCGYETTDPGPVGMGCTRELDHGMCGGTYIEGPLPVFTLTRLEEIDVTYDVKGLDLEDAFSRLESWDDEKIVDRFEDPAAFFSAGEIRYLAEDEDEYAVWCYLGDDRPPRLADAREDS